MKRFLIFGFILFCLIPGSNAQNIELPAIEGIPDSAHVRELIYICREMATSNPQMALKYGEQAVEAARIIGYRHGEAEAIAEQANIYHLLNDYNKSILLYKETINIYFELGEQQAQAENLARTALVYTNKGEFNEAQYFLTQALDIYNTFSNTKKISETLKNITLLYQIQGGHTELIDELRILRENKEESASNMVNYSRYMGLIYFYLGDYELSYKYYKHALNLAKSEGDLASITRLYNSIGILLKEQENYDEALEYYLRALKLGKISANRKIAANTLKYIGLIYEYQGNLDKAINYYLRSSNMAEGVNDSAGLASTYILLGNIYLKQGRADRAFQYIISGLLTAQRQNDIYMISSSYLSLGNLYFSQKKAERASVYYNKSMRYARMVNAVTIIRECYQNLSSMYAQSGDFRRAFEYSLTFSMLKDSIYNVESSSRFKQLQSRFELDSKQNEIDVLRKNYQINELTLQNQMFLRNTLIIGLGLTALFLFFVINRFILTRKQYRLLNIQKMEIATANQELTSLNIEVTNQKNVTEGLNEELKITNDKLTYSESNLLELNASKDKFFSIISHDLRNPFASIISFARVIKRDFHSLSQDDTDELLKELDVSVNQVSNLLENLLQWSRSQTGKISFAPENMELCLLVEECFSLAQNAAIGKAITLVSEIGTEIIVYGDRNMLSTIFRNLVSNAIKFSRKGGKVLIKAFNDNDSLTVSVIDSGVGISDKYMKRIFRVGESFSTHGTADEKGSGLGLILCKEFIERHNGKIWVESTVDIGTSFFLKLPFEQNHLNNV